MLQQLFGHAEIATIRTLQHVCPPAYSHINFYACTKYGILFMQLKVLNKLDTVVTKR